MDSHADLLKIYIDTYYRLFLTGEAAAAAADDFGPCSF